MIRYGCDWCAREFDHDHISTVKLSNSFNPPETLHICADCGRQHMPQRVQAVISWTAEDAPAP